MNGRTRRRTFGGLLLVLAALVLLAACKKQPEAPATAEPRPEPPDPCAGQGVLTEPMCEGDELDAEEFRLIAMINQYRQEHNLGSIPPSPSLALVANRHARDLVQNVGKLSHGWSDCPYQAGALQTYPCMWTAPKRLGTDYPDQAYEAAHAYPSGANAETAFESLQRNERLNAMVLQRGAFGGYDWQAIGVGMQGPYALIWFGQEPDPAAR